MKAVISAGGLDTRISGESHLKRKPMTEIGGRASLLHILENYSHCGLRDPEVCLGYRGYVIKARFVT